jgi:hypothetical protein
MRVNIHNNGVIPILNRKGPLYNVEISPGVYSLLLKMGTIIKMANNDNLMTQPQIQATQQVQQKTPEQQVKKPEPIKDAVDQKIEERLSSLPEESDVNSQIVLTEEEKKSMEIIAPDTKKYTEAELKKLTGDQLRRILNSRGHKDINDPLAPRWRDNNTQLREKIFKTQ